MRILLLAPQPFFTERGTPIAVRALAATLCSQGHQVDLLALHGGEDMSIPDLRLFRTPRPPLVHEVGIGLSPAKLACDVLMTAVAARMLLRRRYDVVHAVEEMIYPALVAGALLGVRVVHDMDSLMTDQIVEKWPAVARWRGPLDAIERFAMRHADLVLGVCPRIVERVRQEAPGQAVHLLPDIAEPLPSGPAPAGIWDLRALAGQPAGPIALYVGNLETYQGVDLLVAAMALLPPNAAHCRLVVVGGKPEDVAAARAQAARLGVADRVILTGPAPLAHLPWLLRQADILCSPRRHGANTPMKIYGYMAAGQPILATRIAAHTQVLDTDCAVLVEPEAGAIAAGLAELVSDPGHGATLARRAATLAEESYGPASFAARVRAAYAVLTPPLNPNEQPGSKRDSSRARWRGRYAGGRTGSGREAAGGRSAWRGRR